LILSKPGSIEAACVAKGTRMRERGLRAGTRAACRLLLALAAGLAGAGAHAQTATFPDRPIKIVVGFSAGGGTDVVARLIALKMSESIGQSVVVENRAGASGLIAAEAVAKSPPDGYTLMMGSQTTLAVAPALYRKAGFDATRDFAGVAMAGISPLVLVIHPSVAAHTTKDVIALAKTRPGGVNFGSGGLGTTPHMTAELFSSMAGIKMTHVAYRGEAPAINDLLGGQIPLMFPNLSAVMGNIKAGQLRAIAVTSAQRSAAAPEVPTIAETALPGFEAATWFALVAPAGTSHEVIARLNREVVLVLAHADVKQRFADLGMSSEPATPEELDAYIRSEIAKWAKVIRDADIRAAE
jgi:tripartite-type tricarboxylate transporter receptor subunit TctC